MKKTNFKKAISLFMAVLMVLSCWVFIAPTKAEAASVRGIPAVNNATYSKADKYGTPVFNGNLDRWFKFHNQGDDYVQIHYPSQIYLDITETLQSAGYFFNVDWHFGHHTDYRILIGANALGDNSQWSGKPSRYYTMTNVFSNYGFDASLPSGYPAGVYARTSSSTDYDLRIVGYGYSDQGSDGFNYQDMRHEKYVLFRSNGTNDPNTATIYLKGTPNSSYSGTTNEYNTSGDSFSSYGLQQNYSGGWTNNSNTMFHQKNYSSATDGCSNYYESNQWAEMQWYVTVYDKANLSAEITEANRIKNASASYTDLERSGKLAGLSSAITTATTALKTRETNQTTINNAETALYNVANPIYFQASDANLLATIQEARNLIAQTDKYSASSINAVQKEIDEALASGAYSMTKYTAYGNTNLANNLSYSRAEQNNINAHETQIRAAMNALALREYSLTFDNLVDFNAWSQTPANNGVISNVTETGFTLTSNSGVTEATSASPYFAVEPGKSYKVDMDFEGDGWDVYIFFCDANGNWIDFADGPTNRYSSNGSTGIDKDNAVFTAPDDSSVVKAQIRVDANGSSNAVTFNNIRVYEEGTVADGVSYVLPLSIPYGSAYGTLPAATRAGYAFSGWVDADGNAVTSATVCDASSPKTLYSTWAENSYNIAFDANGGEGSMSGINGVQYADSQALPASTFTKEGYTFAGWSTNKNAATAEYADGASVSKLSPTNGETVTLYAVWAENTYKVVFNGNGATSGSTSGHTFLYDNVYNLNSNGFLKTNYHFIGWSTDPDDGTVEYENKAEVSKLSAIDGDTVTLYAVWEIDTYTITWVNEDGTVLETDENVAHGIVPTYDGETPVKASTAEYSYNFKGWTPEVVAATKNVTYTATYTPAIRKYTVTWVDEDGTVLETDADLDYGTVISFDGETPTKASTAQYEYTFAAWDGYTEGATVTDDVTFKATYTQSTRTYTVYWVNWDGSKLETDENVPYGTVPAYNAAGNPGRAPDAQYTYSFAGWDKEITAVEGDVTYTATYNTTVRIYGITFIKNDGTKSTKYYDYGTKAEDIAPPANTASTWDDDNHYSYSWEAFADVTGTATYNEVEASVAHDYTGAIRNDADGIDGTHSYLCALGCGKYGAAEGHDWNDGEVTEANDCGNDGVMTYTCTAADCGATYTDVIAATGNHTYTDDYYCDTTATHQLVCDICSQKAEAVACTFTEKYEPKNPEDASEHTAYCICGNTKSEEHSWTSWVGDGNATDNTGTMNSYCEECLQDRTTGCTYELTNSKAASCVEEGFETYECTDENCTNGYTVILQKSGHDWDEGEITTKATCMTAGVKTFTCKNDASHTRTEEVAIDENAHSWNEWEETTAPTCSAVGEETRTCKHNADHVETREVKIDAEAHSWDDGEITTVPTCTKEGVKTFTCKHDTTHTKTEAVSIVEDAHDWNDWEETTAPTCSALGEETRTCKHNPGHKETREVAIVETAHEWNDWEETTAPTCSAPGEDTRTCKHNANHKQTREVAIDEDAHDWNEWVETTAPTCSALGEDTRTCKHNAGHVETREVKINAEAHSWDDGEITTEPTCMEKGVKTFTCQYDASHTRTEAVAIDEDAHTWGEGKITGIANCTAQGEITYTCVHNHDHKKVEKTDPIEDAHNWYTSEVTKNPTCAEEGVRTYTCKYNENHTKEEAIAIVESAHAWDEGTVTKEPTCSEMGEKLFTCSNDASHTRTENIGIVADAHKFDTTKSEENLTRPAKLADGTWAQGYYTFVCEHNSGHLEREYIDRADYTEYDKVVEELEELLGNEYITEELKDKIEDALDNLPQDLIVGEEAAIEEAVQELTKVKEEVAEIVEQLTNCATGNHTYPTDENGNIVYDEVVEPTCTEDGYYVYSCIYCGLEGVEEYKSTGHAWIVNENTDENGWAISVAATCFADGSKTRTCEKGCTETEVIPATNHEGSWKVISQQDPTCSTHGYTEYKVCEACGLEVGKEIIKPVGHYDNDADGRCDSCNRNINDSSSRCGCICHKDNLLMRFIYKILQFFWKLLGIGRACDCGAVHY